MWKKITSKIEIVLDRLAPRKLLAIREMALRILGRTNRRIFLEFLILIILLSSVGIAASRWSTTTIASHGNLRIDGVGIYEDRDCATATTYLDWGTLEPGSTENVTVYIRNEGNSRATIFLVSENWNPAGASSYMHFDSSYDGQALDPEEVVEVTLTLSVSSIVENIQSFSFDVIIGINE